MALTNEGLLVTGVGALLSGPTAPFIVPKYQRSYAWGIENVMDYWDDIIQAMNGKEEDYFVGTIVLSGSGKG